MNTPPSSPTSVPGLPPPVESPRAPEASAFAVPSYAEAEQADGFYGALYPLRLLQLLRKRWITILLVVLFAGCAAAYYLKNATRIYQSKATIELSTRRPRILNQQAAVIEDPASVLQFEETLNTQLEKFKSKSMLPAVIACYRKNNPADQTPDDVLSARLRGGVSFSLLRRTRLVTISFLDSDPAFAARACQAFADGTEMEARSENRVASDAAVAWLEAQARSQKQELERADQAVFDARQSYRVDLLEGERKTVQQALQSFNEALVNVESQLAMEREMLDALTVADLKPELAGKLPAAIARAKDIEGALERWQVAVTERDSLLTKYTAEHPEVKARDQAVTLFRDQAVAALSRARGATAANLDLLKRQADSLRRNREEQSKRASDIERDLLDREMKLASLLRSRSASDASYQGVLSRIQEARLSADENTATVKLIESASLPGGPVSPNALRLLLLAVALGLAGGVGLALVIEALEDQVTGTRDVESGSGVRVLAVVPHVRKGHRKAIATSSSNNRFGEVAEAFAGLRSVLDSPACRERSGVVLVTSALPEEGKTTTCCNLATACARNGQRVLLIDFDLRRPRIAGIFPMPPGTRGLLDFLASRDYLCDELAYETDCPNLSVMASRPVPGASPAELLGGRKVVELVAWARGRYDRVILDTPPLGLVSDALVLSGLADCVLVTARPGVSRRRAVRHTISRFRDVGVEAIAAVLNDVDMSKSVYHGYGPYYHYQRHYSAYHAQDRGGGMAGTGILPLTSKSGEAA